MRTMRTMQGTVGNLELSLSSHSRKPLPFCSLASDGMGVDVTTTGWYTL